MNINANVKSNVLQAWFLTTRPKTLLLSVFPFFIGTLLALPDAGSINVMLMFAAIFSALCIQIGTNFINDAFDVKKGADTATRQGPQRGVQSGVLTVEQVYLGGLACFALALVFGIPLVIKGGVPILFILLISVACGYIYTGGPMPLAYHGLGEVFVLIFFGLVSTMAAYYFQTGAVAGKSILLGMQLGILATMPIAINNLRDIVDDAKVDKKTLAVRFGKIFSRMEITLLAIAPFLLNLLWVKAPMIIMPWFALPIAYTILRGVWSNEPSKLYNRYLGLSIVLYVVFSLLLIAGYIIV